MQLAEVKEDLAKHNISPSKLKGQNFLLDEDVLDDMVDAADVTKDDNVLEIGPGLGVLTQRLAKNAKSVLAIELDTDLYNLLQAEVTGQFPHLRIVQADALSKAGYQARVDWLKEQGRGEPATYKVVANLPYQITSRILREFFEHEPRPAQLVVMVQKEVAERVTAAPGDMSLLSLSVQIYSEAVLVRFVSADSFYPRPAVDSAVLSCDLTKPHLGYAQLTDTEKKAFWRLAKAGFAARRKQVKSNFASVVALPLPEILKKLQELGLSATARAQELSVDQWVALARDWSPLL